MATESGGVPMSAIPTLYRGVFMRSRLEARWARYLDGLDIQWQYEPRVFNLGKSGYLPDFFLPYVWGGLYMEVKPQGGALWKPRLFAEKTGNKIMLAIDEPALTTYTVCHGEAEYQTAWMYGPAAKANGLFAGDENLYLEMDEDLFDPLVHAAVAAALESFDAAA